MCMESKKTYSNKILIVDGYNVLRSGSFYQSFINDPDYTYIHYNKVREALISDVALFADVFSKAFIVFDAAFNNESFGKKENVGKIYIVFSPFGCSADQIIEKIARKSRNKGKKVLVVSSDSTLQNTVFGEGVDRMSAERFSHEVKSLHEDITIENPLNSHHKSTIADRVDAKTYQKLIKMRDHN